MKLRLRIKTILIVSNLMLVLVIALSLGVANLYQHSLIQQTQRALLAQATWIKSLIEIKNVEPTRSYKIAPPDFTLDLDHILPTEPKPVAQHNISNNLSPGSFLSGDKGLLIERMKATQSVLLSSVQIVDKNSVIVAATNQDLISQSWHNRKDIRQALSGQRVFNLRARTVKHPEQIYNPINRVGEFRVHLIEPIRIDNEIVGAVVLSRTPPTVWQQVVTNREQGAAYAVAFFAIVIVIGILLGLAIERPISKLANRAIKVANRETTELEELEHPITYEADQLSQAVSLLAKKLLARENHLHQFIAELSHELKSPVTSLQGAIELLVEHADDMTAEQRARFLSNLTDDGNRLEALVHRALEFAKADHDIRKAQQCSLSNITTLAANYQTDLDVSVAIDDPNDNQIALSESSLLTVISNMLDNAKAAGATTVSIDASIQLQAVVLRVTDNGKGISQANSDKVFTPFFTTRRNQGGTGLGLAIIGSIIEQAGGTIRLVSPSNPTQFELVVPIIAKP